VNFADKDCFIFDEKV